MNSHFFPKLVSRFKLFIDIILGRTTYFYKGLKKYDLIIYDTIYPNPISGFRYAEFTEYLQKYIDSKIIITPSHYAYLGQPLSQFDVDLRSLRRVKPDVYKKTKKNIGFVNVNCKLFYCVFYGSIQRNINILNKLKIPFLFTLYPGGGFNLKNISVMENLRTICKSPYFKGVIVTQKITHDYLVENRICGIEKIKYIFGGIVPQNSINIEKKLFYKLNKDTLDICFCAAKYMKHGKDKGYDIFIETAQRIARVYPDAHFHIIGGFQENDYPLGEISAKCTFYGFKSYDELQNIFAKMDFIFSPNRPNVLGEGLFDGFPLGTVVEASLNGVIPLVTDELHQNEIFGEGEIFICEPSVESFYHKFENIMNLDLVEVSNEVKNKFRKIYSNENQLTERMNYLNKYINLS